MQAMHKFELFTEDKGEIDSVASELFPGGFTKHYTDGFWKGQSEMSVCIVVVAQAGPDAELARVGIRELAKKLNTLNNQQATLIVETVGWGELVTERF